MLSVFLLYSQDRRSQAELCLEALRLSAGSDRLQTILACDGPSNYHPDGVEVLEVPRPGKYYSLGAAWNAAVARCRHYRVLYLDCDRILPPDFLAVLERELTDGVFLYPESLWWLDRPVGPERLARLRTGLPGPELTPDERQTDPALFPSKCPMSGCTAFTLPTYDRVGPMDPGYEGHGYADIDYFMRARRAGQRCATLPARELHLNHGRPCDHRQFMLMNLWSGARYHRVWGVPVTPRLAGLLGRYGLDLDRLSAATLEEVLNDQVVMASIPLCS